MHQLPHLKPKRIYNDPQVVAEQIKAKYPDAVESVSAQGIVVKNDQLLDVARYLHDSLSFDYLNNVTSVDWRDRFEVVYHLTSIDRGGAPITLKVNAAHDNPTVPSLVPVYRGADFQEREVYDLMGIRFAGHPNLRRILLWEGFEGLSAAQGLQRAVLRRREKAVRLALGSGASRHRRRPQPLAR